MRKVKPTLQYSAVECGACSLSAILRYYGKYETVPRLRVILGVSRDGSKASDILKGARSLGLEAKGMKIPVDLFESKMLPCIIFWEFNHFLVLEGFENNRAYLSNPAMGRHSVSMDDFVKSYTGIAMLFKPGPDFETGGNKEPSLFKRISSIPSAYPTISLLILVTSVVTVIPQLFVAASASQFLNSFLGDSKAYMGIPIVLILICSIIISLGSSLSSQLLIRRLQFIVSKKLSIGLFKRICSASFGYLGQRQGTELSTRLTMGLDYSQEVMGTFYSYFTLLIQTLIVTIFMFFISWQLTFMTLLVILINIMITLTVVKVRSDDNKQLSVRSGMAVAKGFLSLLNIETIKSSGIEPLTLDAWLDEYIPVVDQTQKLGEAMNGVGTLSRSSKLFLDFSTLCLGAYLILNGVFSLGGLLAFQFLSNTIQAPLNGITSIGQALQNLDGIIGRLADLDSADISSNTESLNLDSNSQTGYSITDDEDYNEIPILTLKELSYKFGANSPNFFEKISLSFPQGSHTTIVGTSGSGKSTLIKLIAGLLDEASGSVLLNDLEIKSITPSKRSSIVSYVPQDIFLFESNIGENITLWDDEIDNESMIKAARDAEIYDKIISFPLSFDTKTTSFSSKLSGGQQQRLTIARALSRNPKILLLDEATSALDEQTEKKVIKNIYDRRITTISVSHRMYSALSGDRVVVLDEGKIIEQGSPSELKAKGGKFAQLVEEEKTK